MRCQNCGSETDAAYCRTCGERMPHKATKKKKRKKPFYKKWWFWVIVSLFLIGIIGSTGKESDSKVAAEAATAVVTVTPEPTIVPTPGIPNSVLDVAAKLGIGDESFTSEGNGYQCVYGDTIITFVMDGEVVKSVVSGSFTFYSDDAVIFKVVDTVPNSEELRAAKENTKELVLNSLKAPSTAKFPGTILDQYENWSIVKDENNIIVSSYVDAENSFGATPRTNFSVTYDISDGNWTVVGFTFGDEVYVG